MRLQMNKMLFAVSIVFANKLLAAPYYCGSNGGVYADQTFCNTACGGTCQSIQAAASGASGTCDTSNYDGFIYTGSKTFAISKAQAFWDGFPNLAQPISDAENTLLRAIVSNYGGSGAWIGVYDPSLSSAFNVVGASNYTYSDGLGLTYSNWTAGQPDNMNSNGDIGLVSINGEHWAFMQSSGGWSDDGYHVIYSGDYKPKKKGLVQWDGALSCVNGINSDPTSGSTGLWCSDSTGNLAQCTGGTEYTAKTGSSYSYAATGATTLGWDSCQGGNKNWTDATSYCASKGMRLPYANEIVEMGGNVPSCSSSNYSWTASPDCGGGGFYTVWMTGVVTCEDTQYTLIKYGVRCVGNTTTYTCPSGGTLSGSTCTVNTLACPTGYTATTGAETAKGECKKDTPPVCPLGNHTCFDITGGVQNTDTAQGTTDKKANGATDSSGNCLGNLYIFNGNDQRCRVPGIQTGFSDCCQKGDKWFGIGKCSPMEQSLGKLKSWGDLDGQCHYVGDYCSEKWPLIGCVQKKKTYCCFGSSLSRIIQEGGRSQLGISWGSAETPQCRGFTPTEFQKIDFSKIDFSEWIKYDVIPNVQNSAVSNINNTVNNITNSFQ